MANITAITLKNKKYKKVIDLIHEKLPNFEFVEDKTYAIQIFGDHRYCLKSEQPEEIEGFRTNEQFCLTYNAGNDLYVKANGLSAVVLNIGD